MYWRRYVFMSPLTCLFSLACKEREEYKFQVGRQGKEGEQKLLDFCFWYFSRAFCPTVVSCCVACRIFESRQRESIGKKGEQIQKLSSYMCCKTTLAQHTKKNLDDHIACWTWSIRGKAWQPYLFIFTVHRGEHVSNI